MIHHYLTMFKYELKKYWVHWRRIVASLLIMASIAIILSLFAINLQKKQTLASHFTIGIVNQDDSKEMKMFSSLLEQSQEKFEGYSIQFIEEPEAKELLSRGKIVAYIIFPQNFVHDVMVGTNSPITLVGRDDYILTWLVTQSLAQSAAAYLSAAQSGVYATIDYANEHQKQWTDFNQEIVLPINIVFIQKILARDKMFDTITLSQTGSLSRAEYIQTSAIVLLTLLFVASNMDLIRKTRSQGVLLRYRSAGISSFSITVLRFFALWIVILLCTLPLIVIWGSLQLLFSFAVAAFALLSDVLFDEFSGYFMFFSSLIMLFFSGGIIPLVYLPKLFLGLRYLTINYYMLNRSIVSSGLLLLFSLICLLVTWRMTQRKVIR